MSVPVDEDAPIPENREEVIVPDGRMMTWTEYLTFYDLD